MTNNEVHIKKYVVKRLLKDLNLANNLLKEVEYNVLSVWDKEKFNKCSKKILEVIGRLKKEVS